MATWLWLPRAKMSVWEGDSVTWPSLSVSELFRTNANFCWLYRCAAGHSSDFAYWRRIFDFGISTNLLLCLFAEKVSVRAWPDQIYELLFLNGENMENWRLLTRWEEKRLGEKKDKKLMFKHKRWVLPILKLHKTECQFGLKKKMLFIAPVLFLKTWI